MPPSVGMRVAAPRRYPAQPVPLPRRALAAAACLAGVVLTGAGLAGCGPALLVGGLVGLGTLDDDDDRKDTPPAAGVTTPVGVVNDVVALGYRLSDPDPDDRASIDVQYSAGGGPFLPCTPALVEGAEGTAGLLAAAAGTDHVFRWSSAADLGFVDVAGVVVRVLPRDAASGLLGAPATTGAFDIRNRFVTTLARSPVPAGVQATSLAVASDGDVLVADTGGNRVVRVDRLTGAATVVAGTGEGGSTGDGRPGVEATLNGPLGVAATSAGDVVIADTFNGRVRRVDGGSGFITTIAGGGDGDDFLGDLVATSVNLAPRDVAVDARGAVWVLEDGRLHLVNSSGAQPLTVRPTADVPGGPNPAAQVRPGFARTVVGGLSGATALAVFDDGAGRRLIHVVDFGNQNTPDRVRLTAYNDGLAPETLQAGAALVVVAPGSVAEVGVAVNVLGSEITDLALVDAHVLLITTGRDGLVRCANFSSAPVSIAGTTVGPGQVDTVAGNGAIGVAGDGGPALQAELFGPFGVAWDPLGHLLCADGSARLRVAASSGQDVAFGAQRVARGTVGTIDLLLPGLAASVVGPYGLARLGPDLAVTDGELQDPRSNRVLRVRSADGAAQTIVGTGTLGVLPDGPAATARLGLSFGVAADAAGEVVVYSDLVHQRVRAVNLGAAPRVFGGVTLAPGQAVTVVGTGARSTSTTAVGDGGPPTLATLSSPSLLAIDEARGLLWVSDSDDHRLRAVNLGPLPVTAAGTTIAPGTIQTVVGTGAAGTPADDGDGGPARDARLSTPAATLGPDGNLYVADGLTEGAEAPRLRVVNLSAAPIVRGGVTIAPGAIDTVAGSGAPRAPDGSNLGDGGPALAATFRAPGGLAVGDDLVLYLTDSQDSVVRAVNLGPATVEVGGAPLAPGTIRRVVGAGVPGFDGDPSTTAGLLDQPAGLVALPGGLLAISDTGNGAVRLAGLGTGLATFAGREVRPGDLVVAAGSRAGKTRCEQPTGVAVDGGRTLFADLGAVSANPAVLEVDPQTRGVSRAVGRRVRTAPDGSDLGDGGPALLATLAEPFGLCVDAQRGLWIADVGNRRVRFVNRGTTARAVVPGLTVVPGTIVTVLDGSAGDGSVFDDDGLPVPSPLLDLVTPIDVDVLGSVAWVVDAGGRPTRVLRVDLGAGRVDGVLAEVAQVTTVSSTTTAGNAILFNFISDPSQNFAGVRAGDLVRVTAGPVALLGPSGPRPPPFETRVVVDAGPGTPNGLVVEGNIEPDATTFSAQVVREDAWTAVAALDATRAYVAGVSLNSGVGRVYLATYGGAGFTLQRVAGSDVVTDSPGWNGDLRVATDVTFGSIADLALDGAVLYVVDADAHRLVAVNLGASPVTVGGLTILPGEARTVCGAGQGAPGFDGDGVPPANALLSSPRGVARDGTGLVVTDTGNNRVRRFER
jgi:sugar lactone lactonase YvrE